MKFAPYPFQLDAVDTIAAVMRGERPPTCIVAPTGAGKGVIEAAALERLPGLIVTTPSQPIATSIAVKLTGDDGLTLLSDGQQQRACEKLRIFTDMRAKNLAARGSLSWATGLLRDEAHHGTNDTHESLGDLLPVPHAGCTATPYRGTPAGTKALHAMYPGGIVFALRLEAAVARGYVSLPSFRTLPLLDDEQIDVKGGEFVVKSVESAVRSRVGQLVEVLREGFDERRGVFRRATTVVLGSVGAVELVAEAMRQGGLPCEAVTAATKNRERVFARVVTGEAVLLQIRAVGEGVDLPLRVMYDLSPTMSPVLWMQRVGRIMRKVKGDAVCHWCDGSGEERVADAAGDMDDATCRVCSGTRRAPEPSPIYYACCHNLMRHGYLFEGLIPRSAFAEARNVWGEEFKPSRRTMTRALGNTGFGRFLPAEVRLRDGGVAFLYALRTGDGLASYAALLLPHLPNPIYFGRADVLTGQKKTFTTAAGVEVSYDEKKQGRWRMLDSLPDLESCSSYPQDAVFPWMQEKWAAEAGKRGLDATVPPTRKTYQLFRILQDAGRAIG